MTQAYILVLYYHGAGFFSIFNKLMNFLQTYSPVYKIVWNVHCPWNHYGDGEIMSQVFEPYENKKYKDYQHITVSCEKYLDGTLTGQAAHALYTTETCKQHNLSVNWRQELHNLFFSYIQIKQHILQQVSQFKAYLKTLPDHVVVTVLVRHPILACEQPHNKMPSFEQYDNKIASIQQNVGKPLKLIFLTDHQEAYVYFRTKYPTANFPPVDRASSLEQEAHTVKVRTSLSIDQALLSVLYLALGQHFIHPTSNMATAVLYINSKCTNHFLVG